MDETDHHHVELSRRQHTTADDAVLPGLEVGRQPAETGKDQVVIVALGILRRLGVVTLLGSALLVACDGDSSAGRAPATSTATPAGEATRTATASPTAAAVRVSPTSTATATPTAAPTARATSTATPATTPANGAPTDAQVAAALKQALEAKNYGAVGAYMTNPVRLTIESTGCCAPGTPGEAVGNLSRLNSATPPWNFDQASASVVSIKTRYPGNYGGTFLGISADGQVAAFKFNAGDLFESIRLGDTRLLGP